MAWRMTMCQVQETERLNALLQDSWEPFAVTDGEAGTVVWLRRSASPEDASLVMPAPRRGELEVARRLREGTL